MPLKKIIQILLCCCIFSSLSTFSLPTDMQQTLHIIADSASMDYKTGLTTYEGNVKINQGTSRLTADRVITQRNKQHQIEEASAYGIQHPAEYTTIPKEGDKLLWARAMIIRFYPLKSTVVLENKVTIIQGENNFKGPIIIYNAKNQTVNAPPSKDGQATLIIKPN